MSAWLVELAEVRARHIVDLFHKLRTDRERDLAQRTIYNIWRWPARSMPLGARRPRPGLSAAPYDVVSPPSAAP